MNSHCKFRSSWITNVAFTIIVPFTVLFLVYNAPVAPILRLVVIIASLPLLIWFNHVKIYENHIVVSRLFWTQMYRFDQVKYVYQTRGTSPKVCLILLKKGVSWKSLIVFFPVPQSSDIFLSKTEESVGFIRKKINS